MNREQRRAYQKRLKHDHGNSGRGQVCPVCGNLSEFVAVPVTEGKCVPVCRMCGRAAGPAVLGMLPHTLVKLPEGEAVEA